MKKMMLSLAVMAAFLAFSLTAHAAEILERDYIKAEIWEEIWLGKSDDGTEFPESSYKHHLLDKWVDENYGDDDYDWTAIGELKYLYRNYYKNLTENWDFNDDNGIWTIETEYNSYSFQLINNQWNMIDKNGDTVDMFPIFSTLDEENEKPNNTPEDNNNGNNAVGIAENRTKKSYESLDNTNDRVSADSTERAIDGISERSDDNAMPLVVSGLALVGIGVGGAILYKKRK